MDCFAILIIFDPNFINGFLNFMQQSVVHIKRAPLDYGHFQSWIVLVDLLSPHALRSEVYAKL